MNDIIRNVIKSKKYDLADILTKIDTLWVQGNITEEQRLSLITDAQNNAKAENSIDVLNKLYELDRRVTELEKQLASNDSAEEETEDTTYPSYEAGKWYYNGDKISVDGLNYTCIAPIDTVCTWNPFEYPPYWQLETEE